ncbi:hypothetical protein L682_04005 [Aquipseudomonas alcaligenes OT 69]|nr:hypothetical protein L682_04005 [Pseudomonas alcaligenes OT 69]
MASQAGACFFSPEIAWQKVKEPPAQYHFDFGVYFCLVAVATRPAWKIPLGCKELPCQQHLLSDEL